VTRLPRLTGKEMVRFLKQQGFRLLRVRGSHFFLEAGVKRTTVPVHANRDLKTGTLRSILRDIDLSPTEFPAIWERHVRRPKP
jgi:predicted RNA binding protein YcfA (HicA-like mRNA interferase family)